VKLLARSRSCCGGAWGGLLLPALAFAAPQADVRPALFLKFLPERLFKQSAAAAAALLLLLLLVLMRRLIHVPLAFWAKGWNFE